MKFHRSHIFVVLTVFFNGVIEIAMTNRNFLVGDECQGPKNSTGICTRAQNCEFYKKPENWKLKRKFLGDHSKFCRFDGTSINDQVVCCPSRCTAACRRFKDKGKPENLFLDTKIYGGFEAEDAEFPHFAALRSSGDEEIGSEFNCGGVLISEKFVLTAAHCAPLTRKPTSVRLGVTTLKINPSDDPDDISSRGVDVNIENIYLHPDYSISQKYHDIALLELEQTVSFDFNIWPACLKDPSSSTLIPKDFTIAGFGYTNARDEKSMKTDWLMKAYVQETPLDKCNDMFSEHFLNNLAMKYLLPHGLLSSQICSKSETSLASTCQGDSGSGLMYEESWEYLNESLKKNVTQFYVYGITSFGQGSCKSKLPSVYTRVSSYIEWIESIVWPL